MRRTWKHQIQEPNVFQVCCGLSDEYVSNKRLNELFFEHRNWPNSQTILRPDHCFGKGAGRNGDNSCGTLAAQIDYYGLVQWN
jgi:hypothetical protein